MHTQFIYINNSVCASVLPLVALKLIISGCHITSLQLLTDKNLHLYTHIDVHSCMHTVYICLCMVIDAPYLCLVQTKPCEKLYSLPT